MELVEITAGRIHLRPWRPADAADVFAACQDPEIQRWTLVPSPYQLSDAETFVGDVSATGWESGETASFAVVDSTTGGLLGSMGVRGLTRDDGIAEVGYWTVPSARRRGVTAQSLAAVSRWALASGVRRLEWWAVVGNDASRRVAEKAGFTVEGLLRQAMLHRGQWVDAWVGSMLPGDLEGSQKT